MAFFAIASSVSSWGVARADFTNLITNGSFETTTAIAQIAGPDNNTAGYAKVTGWSVPTGGNKKSYSFVFGHNGSGATTADSIGSKSPQFNNYLKLYGPGNGHNNGLVASPDGGNFLGMDGAYQNPAPGHGAISQQVTGLTPGKSYRISFYDAAAQQNTFKGSTHDQWNVTFGGTTQKSTLYNIPEAGFSGWHKQSMVFTATQSTQTLSFFAVSGPSGTPPFALLDGVTCYETPLPSALSLSLIGFLILGAFNMHQRGKRAKANQAPDVLASAIV